MVDTPLALSASGSVTLDASGNGEVRLGPSSVGETWVVENTYSTVAPFTPLVPSCTIYEGYVSSTNARGTTFNGARNSNNDRYRLGTGQFITIRWEGGVAGALATATVSGIRELAGRRAY